MYTLHMHLYLLAFGPTNQFSECSIFVLIFFWLTYDIQRGVCSIFHLQCFIISPSNSSCCSVYFEVRLLGVLSIYYCYVFFISYSFVRLITYLFVHCDFFPRKFFFPLFVKWLSPFSFGSYFLGFSYSLFYFQTLYPFKCASCEETHC